VGLAWFGLGEVTREPIRRGDVGRRLIVLINIYEQYKDRCHNYNVTHVGGKGEDLI
jgi:hypothetical protein